MTNDILLSLLLRSFAGESAAYSELLVWLEKHCHSQLNIVLKSYGNFPKELRNDITQDVLIAFHQTHQTFNTSQPFLPWINSIIRHKAIDFIRRKDFRVQMSSLDIEDLKDTWANQLENDTVEYKELIGFINTLSSKQSQILKLSKVQGLSNEEISAELKMTESNVKVSIHRAVKLLKKIIYDKNK